MSANERPHDDEEKKYLIVRQPIRLHGQEQQMGPAERRRLQQQIDEVRLRMSRRVKRDRRME